MTRSAGGRKVDGTVGKWNEPTADEWEWLALSRPKKRPEAPSMYRLQATVVLVGVVAFIGVALLFWAVGRCPSPLDLFGWC